MYCDTISVFSWSGSHIRWGQAFRLRHLSTGHYLALTEDRGLVLQDREKSDTAATAFCFRASKVSGYDLCVNIFLSVMCHLKKAEFMLMLVNVISQPTSLKEDSNYCPTPVYFIMDFLYALNELMALHHKLTFSQLLSRQHCKCWS